jgi:hypothetical protein
MSFDRNIAYADEVGQVYGTYLSTFRSQTGQVVALVFEQGGRLVAHVSFLGGLKPEDATDSYVSELKQFAEQQNFGDRIRIIYAE